MSERHFKHIYHNNVVVNANYTITIDMTQFDKIAYSLFFVSVGGGSPAPGITVFADIGGNSMVIAGGIRLVEDAGITLLFDNFASTYKINIDGLSVVNTAVLYDAIEAR